MSDPKLEGHRLLLMTSLSKNDGTLSSGTLPSDPNRNIRVRYIPQTQLEEFLPVNQNRVLGLIEYGRPLPEVIAPKLPSISVNMRQLHHPSLTECWTTDSPIKKATIQGVQVAHNELVAFGCLQDEDINHLGLEKGVYSVYSRLFDILSLLGYPHLYRIWNYFPEINLEQEGLERYQSFCVGRHRAFSELDKDFKSDSAGGECGRDACGVLSALLFGGKTNGPSS